MKARAFGATTVEFALVLIIFLTFLLGVVDFSRMLFTWGAATEATRAGARYAVVCDDTDQKAQVLTRMKGMVPEIMDINLAWLPAGCNSSTCEAVSVTITSLQFRWISPIAGLAPLTPITMPTFRTVLPREVMRQDPHSGSLCS